MFNPDGGFTFQQVLEHHKMLNRVCQVEFRSPKSDAPTQVIARLVQGSAGMQVQIGTELTGNEPGARGRPGLAWKSLEQSIYNSSGCTGTISEYQAPQRRAQAVNRFAYRGDDSD